MTRSNARPLPSSTALSVAAAVLLAACAPRPASDTVVDSAAAGSASAVPLPAAPNRSTGAGATDTGAIARLEREARALASVAGCATSEQCRVAPLGHRACGGPRDYLAYCAATTDSAALFRKLDELARAEEAAQARTGEASTCEFRSPPVVTASAGRCVGAGNGP